LILIRDCDGAVTLLDGQPSFFNPYVTHLGPSNEVLLETRVRNSKEDIQKLEQVMEIPPPLGQDDCSFIENLKRAAQAYRPVKYTFPDLPSGNMKRQQYNSNSWVAGMLSATGSTLPAISNGGKWQAPGFSNPVPVPGFERSAAGQDCCCKKK
jgi:hypothetical protein